MEENGNQQRKGFVVSHTMSQLPQQARPSQCGAGDKTRQAQGRELVDRVDPEGGNDPPHLGPWLFRVATQDPE